MPHPRRDRQNAENTSRLFGVGVEAIVRWPLCFCFAIVLGSFLRPFVTLPVDCFIVVIPALDSGFSVNITALTLLITFTTPPERNPFIMGSRTKFGRISAVFTKMLTLFRHQVAFLLFSLSAVSRSFFVSLFLLDLEPWERPEFCKSLLWVAVAYGVLGFLVGYLQ